MTWDRSQSALSARLDWRWHYKYRWSLPSARQKQARRHLIRKIETGVYPLEKTACYCGSKVFDTIAGVDKHGIKCKTVICRECGMVMTNPHFTETAAAAFYENEYRKLYSVPADDIQVNGTSRESEQACCDFIMDSIPGGIGVVFEAGCNFGSLLSVFRDRGCEVAGTDYGKEHILRGRTLYGLENLYTGGIESLGRYGKKADLIILSHVLEHIADLDRALATVHSLLVSGGHVYIAVPGITEWIRRKKNNVLRILQCAHIYYFNLTLLTYVVAKNGFELVYGDETVVAVFKKQPLKHMLLQKPREYSSILRKLKEAEAAFSGTASGVKR